MDNQPIITTVLIVVAPATVAILSRWLETEVSTASCRLNNSETPVPNNSGNVYTNGDASLYVWQMQFCCGKANHAAANMLQKVKNYISLYLIKYLPYEKNSI
jgi:hypothetical protein